MRFGGNITEAGRKVALGRIARYAPKGESVELSLARLARAIRADGGEEYSPFTILRAYCRHKTLRRDFRRVIADWKRKNGR